METTHKVTGATVVSDGGSAGRIVFELEDGGLAEISCSITQPSPTNIIDKLDAEVVAGKFKSPEEGGEPLIAPEIEAEVRERIAENTAAESPEAEEPTQIPGEESDEKITAELAAGTVAQTE